LQTELKITVNPPAWINTEAVEERYKAKFVGEFAIPGMYSEIPWPIFYVAEPDLSKGHKHYFAMVAREGNVYITDASFIENKLITAVRAADGEVIYSKAVHDFVESQDKSVWIDGGFEYTRWGSIDPWGICPFLITVKDGEFVYPSEAANESKIDESEANSDTIQEADDFQYQKE
jgi:hypothetical protein